MATDKTPGVYIREVSTLPPSVAEVSTAIPAFIGYTKIGPTRTDDEVEPVVARIDTMLEYETRFGGAPPSKFEVDWQRKWGSDVLTVKRKGPEPDFLLYYALSMYFKNGGGRCYVISVGEYGEPKADGNYNEPHAKHFDAGLAALRKEDEPTLIVLTDAVKLGAEAYYNLCNAALTQCQKLGDRFTILDVVDGDDTTLRQKVEGPYLKYGAAYMPYLETSLTYAYKDEDVAVIIWQMPQTPQTPQTSQTPQGSIIIRYQGSGTPQVAITKKEKSADLKFELSTVPEPILRIYNVDGKSGAAVVREWQKRRADDRGGFTIEVNPAPAAGADVVSTRGNLVKLDRLDASSGLAGGAESLKSIRQTKTELYNQVKTALSQQRVNLPPSAAVAGIYARVDRDRGVWKAPANVGVMSVIRPVTKITDAAQTALNAPPTGGKSINAIRTFSGRGTLVWGARTLDGDSNEWRYVPVRRLFNMIEESIQKATAFAVFEPNIAATWLRVKAMADSYLYGLWKQEALAGPTPEAAYFVTVGLGKTMTMQDVLEGRMIVEVGVAAVRPAEFIILKFTHKLQEA